VTEELRPQAVEKVGVDREAINGLLSPDGWGYASSTPVEAGDPGRFHALFGRDSLIFALPDRGLTTAAGAVRSPRGRRAGAEHTDTT
jgi:hypothetical protein